MNRFKSVEGKLDSEQTTHGHHSDDGHSTTSSFSSPYAVHTLDQIPTPILKLVVGLGPTVRLLSRAIRILRWQAHPRQSILVILVWIACCLWTWQLLAFGLPLLLIAKLLKDWFQVRTTRVKREALERKRLNERRQREEAARREREEHDDDDNDDDGERLHLQRLEQQKEEEQELISRKIQPDGYVSLDDTLQDLEVVNDGLARIKYYLVLIASHLNGTQAEILVSLFAVGIYVWPLWIVISWVLGSGMTLAVIGTLLLLSPSPWFHVICMTLRRNKILRHVLAAIWAYGVAAILTSWPVKAYHIYWISEFIHLFKAEKQKATKVIGMPISEENIDDTFPHGTRSEMMFQFEVYENQRWWLGMGWTTSMMPSERGPWTDNQLAEIPSKEDFALPKTTQTTKQQPVGTKGEVLEQMTSKQWSWVDGDWWVDMTGELQGRIDHNGWEYGNNAWKQLSGMPGMHTFTRKRRWCRRARLTYIFNKLQVPQHVEKMRPKGSARQTAIERRYPYLQRVTKRKSMSEKKQKALLAKIGRIAGWLDNAVPGSPIPLGLDSLLSFIPFVGGFIGTIFSLYQVYLSCAFGIPLWLLMRMLINVAIDLCIGIIPVLGGVLDMFYKANLWNYEALEDYLDNPPPTSDPSASSNGNTPPPEEVSLMELVLDLLNMMITTFSSATGKLQKEALHHRQTRQTRQTKKVN
ncbi:integral peroxisomal membrane peroxin-domain-containing protein [Radiomyces spectabilis]|uniref:integral peroxisomal membrane peroxin-domain-containing protein n=1 Tax=Radiomyces spectabilis TaxID=64574 RepID=UPI002220335E|nr:integral peroxisomal membrane peroxin-domain-containing protein [Radiomyces spectabilis]KAI8393438.1 integral peroxisomal membrane peroxin-domain-containing protein [Radiomyces spectabilis]